MDDPGDEDISAETNELEYVCRQGFRPLRYHIKFVVAESQSEADRARSLGLIPFRYDLPFDEYFEWESGKSASEFHPNFTDTSESEIGRTADEALGFKGLTPKPKPETPPKTKFPVRAIEMAAAGLPPILLDV